MKHLHPKLILIILLILTPDLTFSQLGITQEQQLKVQVLSEDDSLAVSFATITWGYGQGTITDEDGFARLNTYSADTLRISGIGYRTRELTATGLIPLALNPIYLTPEVFELGEIEVRGKKRRVLSPDHILAKAFGSIRKNYPSGPIVYHGYYREYTKQDRNYINVLESIIDLEDPGFRRIDKFQARLYFKRLNQDFRTDGRLLSPYDNENKYVPYAVMPIQLNNELLILRAHDPIRNYKRFSFDFLGILREDFREHHSFERQQITYLDSVPIYQIRFRDNRDIYARQGGRIRAEGSIFINANDFGIHRIQYRMLAESELETQKLFEVNVEYRKRGEDYSLNYISFNNLYKFRHHVIQKQTYDPEKKALTLHFNREVNKTSARDLNYYLVNYRGESLEIGQVLAFGNRVELRIRDDRQLEAEDLEARVLWMKPRADQDKEEKEIESYYQYREFFVKSIERDMELESGLLDKTMPLFNNPVTPSLTGIDASWLNTPLIAEEVQEIHATEQNRRLVERIVRFPEQNKHWMSDQVYLHVDREVYAPGDTLWLKGYIRSNEDLGPSDRSTLLNLQLADEKGKVIDHFKFLAEGSSAKGQFELRDDLAEGFYYLIAYSSWMENHEPDEVFRKKILIKQDQQESYRLYPAFDRQSYQPGDTLRIAVSCLDQYREAVRTARFNYRITDGERMIQKGKGSTSEQLDNLIELVIPKDVDGNLSLYMMGKHKGLWFETEAKVLVRNEVLVGFYPQGGRSINEREGLVAFKATDNNGIPVRVKGRIAVRGDITEQQVVSEHDGMGTFLHTPKKDSEAYFILSEPLAFADTFRLPAGQDNGWSIHAEPVEDSLRLKVEKSGKNEEAALAVLKIRDHIHAYELFTLQQEQTLQIPTRGLPHGIGVITIYDENVIPQAERLVFIGQGEGDKVRLRTGSPSYTPRDSVQLKIRIRTPEGKAAKGTYSLSVVDEELGSSPAINEANMVSSLLLSPEIKGQIHDPNHYADLGDSAVRSHLDLLLLTQGWRNYRDIEALKPVDSLQLPVNRDVISGVLRKPRFGLSPKAVEGIVNVNYALTRTDVPTDKKGRFSFHIDYDPVSNPVVYLNARDAKGNEKVELLLDSSAFTPQLSRYLSSHLEEQAHLPGPVLTFRKVEDRLSLEFKNHHWIEEVRIIARRGKEDDYLEIADNFIFARSARPDQLEMARDVEDVLANMGYFLNIDYQFPCMAPGLEPGISHTYTAAQLMHLGAYVNVHWFVNEMFTTSCINMNGEMMADDFSMVEHIRPGSIERITVVRGLHQIRSGYGREYDVVVDIRYDPVLNREHPMNFQFIRELSRAKEFYSPLYDTPEKEHSYIQDLRRTIHWEPELELDERGECELVFYNADRYTRIRCTLEGISDQGDPVNAEVFYDVTLQN